VATLYWVTSPAPGPLALRVQDNAGQLVISWDKTNPAGSECRERRISKLAMAVQSYGWKLDREQLRTGNVTYKRRLLADVTVRLVVQRPGALAVEEMARFLRSGWTNRLARRASDATRSRRPAN